LDIVPAPPEKENQPTVQREVAGLNSIHLEECPPDAGWPDGSRRLRSERHGTNRVIDFAGQNRRQEIVNDPLPLFEHRVERTAIARIVEMIAGRDRSAAGLLGHRAMIARRTRHSMRIPGHQEIVAEDRNGDQQSDW
jgi:hypothetical protein